MRTVVNGAGTGRQARLSGIEVCGKTGTSQRVSNELRLRAKREDFEDDAWFVGFAPCSSPEIVVAVLLENGRHSYYAAAVARDVLQAWRVKESQHLLTDLDRTLAASKAGPRPMVSEE
jgi:penicillin-binding protein 2